MNEDRINNIYISDGDPIQSESDFVDILCETLLSLLADNTGGKITAA